MTYRGRPVGNASQQSHHAMEKHKGNANSHSTRASAEIAMIQPLQQEAALRTACLAPARHRRPQAHEVEPHDKSGQT
eukprot:10925458-Alexandrium_andersonii.AAC.1